MAKHIGMFLLALLAGYAVMIIGIFGAQEGLFGGVTFHKTPLPSLLIVGMLTTLCAMVGGGIAAWIFGKPYFPPALGLCGLVIAESIYMIGSGQMPGPLWFDTMASGSLVFGILLGVYVVKRFKPESTPLKNMAA